jgi:hypothetical protein
VSVLLSDTFLAQDEENYDKAAEVIDIDIGLSAYANARFYYDKKKQAIEKNEKTRSASAAALQSAEIKAKASMHDVKKLKSVTALRKPFWFEKFHWFISSDNIIVIGGRDISQNELLYKKYLQKGDWYFHADIHGASSVIVKNPTGEPLPLNTIWQAGSFALCHSSAWKNKVMSDTFYVNDSQVSKTAPTGEYVSSGGFIIRGKKNYCTQNQLVMGFGIMFKVADESIINHIDERKPKIIEMVTDPNDNKGWQPKNKNKEKKTKDDEEDNDVEEVEDGEDSDDIDEDLLTQSPIVNLLRTSTVSESKDEVVEEKVEDEEEADIVGIIKSKKTVSHVKHQQPQKKKEQPKQKQISKAKQKKIEKKYGWQNEDDRKAHMEALGHKFVENPEGAETTISKKELELQEQNKQKEIFENQKAERENKRIRREREEEEVRELMREEKIDQISDADKKKIEETLNLGQGINLSSLTGKPAANDIIMFALPYCGPYDCMKDFKFKAKILPGGSQKKGSTARSIIYTFLNNPDATAQEKEAIKLISEEEFLLAIINTPKVSMPGIQNTKNKSKQNNSNNKSLKESS